MLYGYNHNIDLRNSVNERTHFFIKICISHTLFSKGLIFLLCERWVETGTDCYIDPSFSPDHSSSSSSSWLGLLDRGSLRAIALSLQAGPHSSLPVHNQLNCRRYLPIFFHNAHLFPLLLPLIYTGASLIDGLVKGQYKTKGKFFSSMIILHTSLWETMHSVFHESRGSLYFFLDF